MPSQRPLTVLRAPGGFGKTTLLAQCCEAERERGLPVVWLQLDDEDDEAVVDTYLAFAFDAAGIDPVSAGAPDPGDGRHPRTRHLLGAVASAGTDCVLVLDEAERVTDAGALDLLGFLVTHAPPELHIAIACREVPLGLDVAVPVLEGRGEVLVADDLRFSARDAGAFLGEGWAPAELKALTASLGGWPIALRIRRNEGRAGAPGSDLAAADVVGSWVESRLWRSLPAEDREAVLDVGLFEWFDGELLDEVFDAAGVLRRIGAMPALGGLVEPVRIGRSDVWQLHALLREHCARRGWRERPERCRWVHRRIAGALARRGRFLAAMRHARAADDAALAATVLVDAGGILIWFSEGKDRLVAADRYLPRSLSGMVPRTVLVRAVALAAAGRLEEAHASLASLPPVPADGPPDLGLDAERTLARGIVAYLGCEPSDAGTVAMLADAVRLADAEDLDPALRGVMELVVCIAANQQGYLEEAGRRADRVERLLGRWPFVRLTVAAQGGLLAMAQGRVGDAAACYERAGRLARENYLRAPELAEKMDMFLRELALERCRHAVPGGTSAEPSPVAEGAEVAMRFAACDLTLAGAREEGVDAALVALDEMASAARRDGLAVLDRHLAAWRTSLLADAGRVGEAGRVWKAAAMPESDAACMEVQAGGWREVESVACARIRLLVAEGDLEAARRAGEALLQTCAASGNRRTEMRALALCARVEHEAQAPDAADGYLGRFVERYLETDYAYGLVRDGAAAAAMLTRFVGGASGRSRAAGEALLAAVRERPNAAGHRLTSRETEVLGRLETHRDKDIAAELGISHDGVRYHVRNLFAKLGVRSRGNAVRRARALGLMPD